MFSLGLSRATRQRDARPGRCSRATVIRSIAGGLFPAIVATACSVGLPDNVADYMRANGKIATTATDAGVLACTPALEADGGAAVVNSRWRPPSALHRGVCTSAQADQLVLCVYTDPFHMTKPCQDFLNAPENAACARCGYSDSTEPVWGAIYSGQFPESPIENVEGCVAALSGETTTSGCGAKLLALFECQTYVCRDCQRSESESYTCGEAAAKTLCAPFATAAACADPFMDQCLPMETGGRPSEVGRKLVKMFCER